MSVWAGAMSDPRDIDEDAILKGLSAEELDKLEYELQEMDPEVLMWSRFTRAEVAMEPLRFSAAAWIETEIYNFVKYWFLLKWIFFWLLLLQAEANK